MGKIDETLLSILACPLCREPVVEQGDWLVCQGCRRKYPIRDGIPIMLPEEAVEGEGEAGQNLAEEERTPTE
jgi:uncharacterized protein YbaR (Trm112 family)